jgi:hypothetical protein
MAGKDRRGKSRAIVRTKMKRLLELSGGKCHWCGVPIVHLRGILRRDRIETGSYIVKYRNDGGNVRIAFIASADHLEPISRGGSDRMGNLVASCIPCNWQRNEIDHIERGRC